MGNFSATPWRELVTFNEMMMIKFFVLDQHYQMNHYNVCASSLKQQFTGRHVAPLRHIILVLSQPQAACLMEKQQIPILVFGLTRPWLEPTIYRNCEASMPHNTPPI